MSRNGSATVYTYDDAVRLKTFQQNLVGTANDLTNTFTYNPASQVVTLNKSNTSYNYVGNANRAGTYVTNGLNQYTSVGGSVLQYTDAKGNLTKDGADTYIYDDENRLVSTSGSVASTLKYDPLGRLYETTIAGVVTRFLYDGDALVAEYNSSNGLTRRYAHGDQVDEPWVQYNTSLTGSAYRRFLHADHQGSIIAHSDGSGNVLNKLTYDSYGIPGTNNLERFGYTGQIWLKGLGLFHYKARMYSPRLGRFLQTDPIFYADQMNMYAYVGNDPVNAIDPTGMESEALEDLLVTTPKPPKNPFCLCLVGAAAQSLVNAMVEQQQRNMMMAATAIGLAVTMLNESSNESSSEDSGSTEHGEERAEEAETNPDRQVGDSNKVVKNGKKYTDSESGHTVHVSGDRVVVTNSLGQKVTQFKNPRNNTQDRVKSGRWVPQ